MRANSRLALASSVILLAACQISPAIKVIGPKTPLQEPDAPTVLATSIPKGPAAVTLVPRSKPAFRPQIPSSLSVALPGGLSGVVSDHGAGIIANNSSGIIANNSGGIIGNHGASYRLAAAGSVVDVMASLLNTYTNTRSSTDGILELARANSDDLFAGKTVPLIASGENGTFIALKLFEDHAELKVWDSQGGKRQMLLFLSFSDAQHGHAVYLRPGAPGGKPFFVVASDFDLDAGTTSEDAYFNGIFGAGHTRLHFEVSLTPKAAPVVGKVRVGGIARDASSVPNGNIVATARVLADNTAAAIFGLRPDAAPGIGYIFKMGAMADALPGDHGFFLSAKNTALSESLVTPALRALVPADDDVLPTLPPDPAKVDPFLDPIFAMPE